jgi:hypothetical protein
LLILQKKEMTERELQQMADAITQMEEAIQEKQANLVKAANALDAVEERNKLALGLNRIEKRYGDVIVVQHSDYEWGVIDTNGNIIVPFGKYGWIDGFDSGLARVRSHGHSGRVGNEILIIKDLDNWDVVEGKDNIQRYHDENRLKNPQNYAKWGIINEEGEEVLPVEYDDIWNFLGKNRFSTKVVKNGVESDVYFHDLNPSLPIRGTRTDSSYHDDSEPIDDYGSYYGEYAGTYAQDVAGYSDDVINDAFDGEPDAYWNID